MEVKKEPLDSFSENPQISPTNFFKIKKEPRETDEMCFEIPTDEVTEVHASDLYVKISELDKIIKQEASDCILPKTEFLTTNCDLPTIKSDNFEDFNQPCSSKQSQKLLKQSKKNVLKKKKYPCPICQKKYTSSKSRIAHLNGHFGKSCVVCTFCGKIFSKKNEFFNDHFTHFVKRKSYSPDNINFNRHKMSGYSANKKNCFPCTICSKYFTKHNLTIHIRVHTGEKPFTCDICLKTFKRKFQLSRHKATHTGLKPYKCQICSRRFTENSRLNIHFRIHTGETPFQCDICLKSFNEKSKLTRHQKVHTEEKPFRCSTCSKTFKEKSKLMRHEKIHTGECSYKCEICNKYFNEKFNFIRHQKVHTGERPHQCEICLKSYIQKSQLTSHYRNHTGEKPYKCNICKKSFMQNWGLLNHIRKLH